jgi:hypothetical protein
MAKIHYVLFCANIVGGRRTRKRNAKKREREERKKVTIQLPKIKSPNT